MLNNNYLFQITHNNNYKFYITTFLKKNFKGCITIVKLFRYYIDVKYNKKKKTHNLHSHKVELL